LELQAVLTGDGSPTLYAPQFGQHYHSVHGALQESEHVFIEAGLRALLREGLQEITLFEMGFGTGLNAWLTAQEETAANIRYLAVEAYPAPAELLRSLDYPGRSGREAAASLYEALISAPWNAEMQVLPRFRLHKLQGRIEDIRLGEALDLVYFDAFAPESQPELWTEGLFSRLWQAMKPGGIWVSYCAKGTVRRALQAAGFEAERLPGPPGKREMLRARKPRA
jgi:tRNA U34 5-methylaminomethyl-2-thiouridine-forming methyltransferase MnmC